MREIKFRCWDTALKVMRCENFMKNGDKKGCWIEFISERGEPYPRERFEIMQFTGIIDRKGKNIYEGDIVRWYDEKNDEDTIDENKFVDGIVRWKSPGFEIEQISKCINNNGFDMKFYSYDGEEFFWFELEAIGNIYEK